MPKGTGDYAIGWYAAEGVHLWVSMWVCVCVGTHRALAPEVVVGVDVEQQQ